MGASTVGLVMTENKDVFAVSHKVMATIQSICRAKSNGAKFTSVRAELSGFSGLITFLFKLGEEERGLSLHFDGDSDGASCGLKDGPKLILSLGAWGSSIEIMEAVLKSLKVYGSAYLIDNDCIDYELVEV